MIVVGSYDDGSGFDVISPCCPGNDSDEMLLESDFFNLRDIHVMEHVGHYFRFNHRECNIKIWEFPMKWESVQKVVRFNRDDKCQYSPDEIVERARNKMIAEGGWDPYNDSSERFVCEILSGKDNLPKTIRQKISATGGELAIMVPSFSVKNIHNVIKIVLHIVKFFVKLAFRGKGGALKSLGVLTKAVKILKFVGLAIGPIIDVIVCVVSIMNKRQRYKNGEISKKEFYKYIAQKIGELATNLLFTVFAGLCFLIPGPVVNILVSIAVSVIGLFASKLVGWLCGVGFEFIWDLFHKTSDC